jgi:hypothetical protein
MPLLLCLLTASTAYGADSEVVEVRRIWDAAPHNAFTDLIRYRDRWFCAFREGKAHVSPDGALRVLTSADGKAWESAALITSKTADLRDPKLCVTPDEKLMLTGAAAWHKPNPATHQTLVWLSDDGSRWSDAIQIGQPNDWLWRISWREGGSEKLALAVGYACVPPPNIRLYQTDDGQKFRPIVDKLFTEGEPSEATILFDRDGGTLCLVRRDGKPNTAILGAAKPPYTSWGWKVLDAALGGPNLIRLPDGRLVAAGRRYDGRVRTSLCWLDPAAGKLTEFAALPSGGDTSYPGLVWHDKMLWVSYYSSHESKTSIYLAKVRPAKK